MAAANIKATIKLRAMFAKTVLERTAIGATPY
jgi:hypothetical protein